MKDNGRLVADPRKLRAITRATAIDQRRVENSAVGQTIKTSIERQFLRYYWMRPPIWRVLIRALDEKRMTPSFVSVGAARCGTTLFSDYIMQHPCVVLPLAKEIGLTVTPTLRLLTAQFPKLSEKRRIEARNGMAITGYCTPVVPNLMFPYVLPSVAPNLKILLILRNPVERTFAHWRWESLLGRRAARDPLWRGVPGFDEVIRTELEAAKIGATGGFTFLSGANNGGFIQNSIYLPFLRTLFGRYDRSDALIIDSDEFFSDPSETAKRAYRFLGLPDYEPVPFKVRNAGPTGEMESDTRQALADFFEPLNRQLYDYIGQDFGWS